MTMPERAPYRAAPLRQKPAAPTHGLAEDYARLEATLRGTPLGRWFLAEYARRNRTPETQLLLDAITRLELAVLRPQRRTGLSSVLGELVEISEAIARTRREIAQIRPPHKFDKQITDATEELDHIVEATETATSEILSAAEDVQELAWTLREKGVAVEFCDRLDQRAIDIYTACSFQDITGQRTGKVVRTLRLIEQRINAMIEVWGVDDITSKVDEVAARTKRLAREDADLLSGPPGEGEGLKQDDVDEMLMQPQGPATPDEAPTEASQGERFERPEPLTLSQLHGVKRAALFG
jgi:chemotaxis regulatin CheY-phosphate phosphatase CheZ